MAMKLEQIVERMEKAPGYSPEREKWIAGIRAHLSQPAQAVGEVILPHKSRNGPVGTSVRWYGRQPPIGTKLYTSDQPAQAVDVEPLRKGFMTAESCGPDGHYLLKVKFQTLDDLQAAHNALTRALAGEKAEGWRVPKGWKLVPIESTDEMDRAGEIWMGDDAHPANAWTDMLEAAPTPPTDGEE